jgi:hypothetical protein
LPRRPEGLQDSVQSFSPSNLVIVSPDKAQSLKRKTVEDEHD